MTRILEFLLSGCWHNWVRIEKSNAETLPGSVFRNGGILCLQCGNWKKKDLI